MKHHFQSTKSSAPDAENAGRPARHRLFGALSAALVTTTLMTSATAETALSDPSEPTSPQAQNWPVQTCQDTTSPGSLRYIAIHAQSGDTIDFSQLPMLCGMADSTITLTAGEIVLHQPNITLLGPAPGDGTVTISAGGASRVLRHQMYSPFNGELQISDLRFTDGYAQASGDIGGGCIYSDANVSLIRSVVSSCIARSDSGSALGGAIDAPNGETYLVFSTISGSSVHVGSNTNAFGGGISSHTLLSKYSEISGNRAEGGMLGIGEGGGANTHLASLLYSTFADNYASTWGGGLFVGSNLDSTIVNSTFSGNHSSDRGGAIFASMPTLTVRNTTIAFNTTDVTYGAGIYFKGTTADIESTIIAKNVAAPPASGADVYVKSGTLTGAGNLVMSSNTNPSGVIASASDPMLAPLAWAGGVTRTHMLLAGSPALGLGNNNGSRTSDQRGAGYPRTTGPSASVDIGAVQFDTIFVSDMDL